MKILLTAGGVGKGREEQESGKERVWEGGGRRWVLGQ